MIGIVVVARGGMTAGLLVALKEARGDVPGVGGVTLLEGGPIEAQRARIRERVAELDQGRGVLILTDALDGSAGELSGSLLGGAVGATVSGVNLPMLLGVVDARETLDPDATPIDLGSLAEDFGRHGIIMTQGLGAGA